jgi:hypothetical protein
MTKNLLLLKPIEMQSVISDASLVQEKPLDGSVLPPIPETVMKRLRDHLRDQFPATHGNIRLTQLLQAVEDEISTAWSSSNFWRGECTRWGAQSDKLRAEIAKLKNKPNDSRAPTA